MDSITPQRILMVSYSSFMQKYYQTLASEIGRLSGAKLKVLVPPYWKELWSKRKIFLEKTSDPYYEILIGKILFPGNLHFAVFRNKLYSVLKRFNPHIIDLEDEPFNLGSFQTVAFKKLLKIKSKILLHASQNKFKTYPPPFNFIEKYVLRNVDAIFVRNTMAKKVLIEKNYEGIMEVVPHGVDVEAFKPSDNLELCQKIKAGKKPVIGYVGSLAEHKGIKYLIEAVAGLSCKLVLVGGGSEKSNLIRQATELNIDADFIDQASHSLVSKYYNCMDLFVLPSLTRPNWSEKFGRVLIEAMASGVPIIGSNSGEIPNVLKNVGIIFNEADAEDLRKKIDYLLNNKQERQALSNKGRETAVNKYSWTSIARQTIDIYHKLLN
jgi:glycosyltransferase involved in cell wall biosynthesis